MELLDLVRRHARRRLPTRRLAAALSSVVAAPGDWARIEAALQGELLRSPRAARRVIGAFRDVAACDGTKEAVGRAARLAGSYEAYVGHHEASLPLYAEAAAALAGAARDGARLGSAAALLRLGRFDDAVAACRSVRRAARRRGDALLAAGADLNEAVARHERGDPARALPLYERAETAFRDAARPGLAATAVQNRANALVLLDRYAYAAPLYRRAQHAFDELGVHHEAARCRYNVGALLAATDRFGEADAELRAAGAALTAAGDGAQAALALLDRAEVLLRVGLPAEARDLASRARRSMARGVPPVERQRAVLVEARALLLLGRGRAARALLRRSAGPAMKRLEAERCELLARADALAGRHAPAASGLREAARRQRRDRHPVGAARALTAAAWSAWAAGDAAAARRDLARAARDLGDLDLPSAVHAREAVAFLVAADSGRRAAADRALAAALGALERVRDGLGADAFRAAALRGREAWFARAVRHVLDGSGGAPAALALLERWRARALRDLLAGAARLAAGAIDGTGAGTADSTSEMAGDADALRDEIARLERRLGDSAGAPFLRVREVDPPAAARALAGAERRLREALRLAPTAEAAAPRLEVLRRSLPQGTLAISLFADDEGALLFALSAEGTRLVRTGTTVAEIASRVEALRFQLGQFELGAAFARRHAGRLARRTTRLLDELGAATFEPLADEIARAARIVIVPHGPWHHAPLAALRVGGAPLLAHADVALTPALGALQREVVRARGAPLVLGMGDEAAPTIAREARGVAKILGARLYEVSTARFSTLRRRRSPSSLHIAAHGRYRADAPILSGVRLHDGWLRAAEFPRLALAGSTVVLSGCETGLSTVSAGDEVQGLVRGVFASGAAELVASLWRVDDPATADLMVRMHRARRRGLATDAALSAAQRALCKKGLPVWYWAGFQAWTRRLR